MYYTSYRSVIIDNLTAVLTYEGRGRHRPPMSGSRASTCLRTGGTGAAGSSALTSDSTSSPSNASAMSLRPASPAQHTLLACTPQAATYCKDLRRSSGAQPGAGGDVHGGFGRMATLVIATARMSPRLFNRDVVRVSQQKANI